MSRYSDLVVAQGADHYWSLSEATGTYFDSIGTAHLDTLIDMSTELAVVNNGAKFNGTTSLARTNALDTTLTFLNSAGFSYSYIVKFISNYTTNRGVFSKRTSGSNNRSFASFVFNASNGTGLSFDIGNSQTRWSTNYYPPLNEWVHICYTYDPSTATGRAYVNGASIGSITYSSTPTSTTGNSQFMIGAMQSAADGSGSNFLLGSINAIAFFTRKTLSEAEVMAQYATAFPIMRVFDGTNWNDADRKVL